MVERIAFWRRTGLVLVAALGIAGAVGAADNVAQPLGDPVVEARVHKLSEELRCLTCMGQSIADSQSGFSTDMKREIRTMIQAGKSDREIMDFMVQRYGDFVLYRPPVKTSTWLLWGGPFVLMLAGVYFLLRRLRGRAGEAVPQLDDKDHEAAAKLLGLDKESGK